MNLNLKEKMLSVAANLIHHVTVKNVNSACSALWGQPKEPVSLKGLRSMANKIHNSLLTSLSSNNPQFFMKSKSSKWICFCYLINNLQNALENCFI